MAEFSILAERGFWRMQGAFKVYSSVFSCGFCVVTEVWKENEAELSALDNKRGNTEDVGTKSGRYDLGFVCNGLSGFGDQAIVTFHSPRCHLQHRFSPLLKTLDILYNMGRTGKRRVKRPGTISSG